MKRFVCFLLTFLMIVSLVPATVLTASAASSLKTSDQAIEFIKRFEGFSQKPYQDSCSITDAGHVHANDDPWYIGYGTSITAAQKAQYVDGITVSEATALLKNHLNDYTDKIVNDFAKKHNIAFTQYQHDALASLTYNAGSGWTAISDSVCQAIKNGYRGNDLLNAFASWSGSDINNEYFHGLMNRRLAEANMFLNNIYNTSAPSSYAYVMLDLKGGSGVNKQFAFMTSTSPRLPSPTKSGDKFLGWYLVDAEKGTETPVTVLDKTLAKKTLIAKWQNGNAEVSTNYTINTSEAASRNIYWKTEMLDSYRTTRDGWQIVLKSNSKFEVYQETIVDDVTNPSVKIKWVFGKGTDTKGVTVTGWIPYKNMAEEDTSSDTVISTGTVNATTLSVYEAPTNAAELLKNSGTPVTLKKGDIVRIFAYKNEYTASGTKSWGKIKVNNLDGWINLAYVALRDATEEDNNSLLGKSAKVVNSDTVNVRNLPGTTGTNVKYTIKKDTKVTIYETRQIANGSTWARVKWNNDLNEGWIYMYYLQVDGQGNSSITGGGSSAMPDVVLYTGIVNSNINLNVRTGPSVGSTQVGSLPRGTKVSVYEKTTTNGVEWGRIDKDRWVCLLYVGLTATGNAPSNGSGDAEHVLVKKVGTVTASALILRKEATNNSEMLDTLDKDTKVTIVEQKDESTSTGTKKWGKVTYNGKEGWINLAYVEIQNVTETIPDTPSNPETGVYGKVVNCINVNVRSDAGVGNTLVTQLKNGTIVTVYEQITKDNAPWGRIKEGWVCMNYIELTGQSSGGSGSGTGSGDTANGTKPGVISATGTVNSNIDLNVRNGAGLGNGKIGSLKKGTKVTVYEQKIADGMTWGKIKYNGADGWICMSYITIDAMSSSGNGTSVMGTIARCFSAANVRSAAGVGNALVGTIPVGSRVEVFEKKMVNGEYWARVSNGWVCMQYVILDEELPDAPATTEPTKDEKPVDSEKENPNASVNYSFSGKTTVGVDVYKDAIDTSDIAGIVAADVPVTILSLKTGKDGRNEMWGRINDFGTPGWINLEKVDFEITGYVHASTLNVYASADPNSENIGTLSLNDKVTVNWLGLYGNTVFGKVKVVVTAKGGTPDYSYVGWVDMSKLGSEPLEVTPELKATKSIANAHIIGKTTTKTPAYTSEKATEIAFYLVANSNVEIKQVVADHGTLWGEVVGVVEGEDVTAFVEVNKLVYVCKRTANVNVELEVRSVYGSTAEDTLVCTLPIGTVVTYTSLAVDANGDIWAEIQSTNPVVDGAAYNWIKLTTVGVAW